MLEECSGCYVHMTKNSNEIRKQGEYSIPYYDKAMVRQGVSPFIINSYIFNYVQILTCNFVLGKVLSSLSQVSGVFLAVHELNSKICKGIMKNAKLEMTVYF